MTSVNATFDVPDYIEDGLEDGRYERIGGVIRDSGEKTVVAWLRENNVSRSINFGPLSNLVLPFIGILNMGISVGGFALVLGKLKKVEAGLKDIEQKVATIDKKIDFGNYANLASAIQQANSAFMMSSARNREASATQAIDRLLVAEHYFASLFDEKMKEQDADANCALLSTIWLAHTTEVLCYLELNEPEVALDRIITVYEQLYHRVGILINWLMSLYDAPFLHPHILKTEHTNIVSRIYNIYKHFDNEIELPEIIALQNQKLLDRAGKYNDRKEWTNWHNNSALYLNIMEAQAEEERRFGAYAHDIRHIIECGISWHEWRDAKPKSDNPDASYFLILP